MNTTHNVPVALVRSGRPFSVADGFHALGYRDKDFEGAMDPLVMVDHYTMTQPTFGPHPHAGLSAVSIIFEDSVRPFHNRDSLGNDFDIMPGDLYWLKAGAGAIHDESPRQGAKVHGLQVFVNLPALMRHSAPESLHVSSQYMPVIQSEGSRVRLVLGESQGLVGAKSPALPMTILDGFLESSAQFSHVPKQGENAWLIVVSGQLTIGTNNHEANLSAGQAIALAEHISNSETRITLHNNGRDRAHFVLFAATPIKEKYLQKGPFIMSSHSEISQVEVDFAAGKFGQLD